MISEQLLFSIIIPTYARPEQLKRCLESLANIAYPSDQFEVLVVNDGSDVPIQPVTEDYRHRISTTILHQENSGPATARNTGACHAKGKHFIFTDDDCTLAPDYLTKLAHCIQDEPDAMIGGRTINGLPNNPYATASQLLIDYLYRYFNPDQEKTTLFTSNNLVVPAEQFKASNGFDTSFPLAAGEDRELCDRWQHEEHNMIYAPQLVVYHSHDMTLRSFWRQHFNYGRGAFHVHQLRSSRGQSHLRPEPLSFYRNLLCYPLRQELGWWAWLLVGLLFIAQVANAFGFFWEVRKRK